MVLKTTANGTELDLSRIAPEPSEWDDRAYRLMITETLTPEQIRRVATPSRIEPRQEEVLAIHWHPEWIPMDVIMQRVRAMYPNLRAQLIIPTQHNVLMEYDGLAGVEIDCFSAPFNRKVQLLAHFSAARVQRADALRAMLSHTFKYRASQLWEYIDSILEPAYEERVERAAAQTGADADLVRFCRLHVARLKALIQRHERVTPPDMFKNKLVRNYFHALRELYDEHLIGHAQVFLRAVKEIVKAHFSLTYFYRVPEIIEEVRGLGGGVVIPHPEQFWPILLADYDVDGIEVWNPQSREFTEFLIQVVSKQNKTRPVGRRPLLITMGDDTHFGEKVLNPAYQEKEKAGRELGLQPAWDELGIRKRLSAASTDRGRVIEEYRARLL